MMARAVEGDGLIPTPYVVRGVWTDFSRGRASKIRYLPDRQMVHCRAQSQGVNNRLYLCILCHKVTVRGLWVPRAVSLWHKGGFYARKKSIIGRPYVIKTQRKARNAPLGALSCFFMT